MDPDQNNDTEQVSKGGQSFIERPDQTLSSGSKNDVAKGSVKSTHNIKNLSKKPLTYIIAITVVLVGIFALFSFKGDDQIVKNNSTTIATDERVATLGASIVLTEGTVEYSDDGEDWQEARGGESLEQLDYVRTLDKSRVIVLFDDGSVARLDSNTEVWLSTLETTGTEITLVDGQVYSRIVESDEFTFTVVTANERFEALGTAYKTSTDGTDDTLEVYQSEVKVDSQEIEVSEGNQYDTTTKQVKAIDLAQLDKDEFTQWNKQKDTESDEFKDKLGVLKDKVEAPTAPPAPTQPNASITLSATETTDGVKLTWSLNGVSSRQGFKIVRSGSDTTPTYGENEAQYVGDSTATTKVWYSDKGGSHYYRVCIYYEGTCSNYSNMIKANSPVVKKEPILSGSINLSINGQVIDWSLTGGNAPHGYKVVLSSSPNPVYPDNSIQYTGATTANLPEKAPGTYYVRVCKYTNGTQDAGCVDYSNQITYVVAE